MTADPTSAEGPAPVVRESISEIGRALEGLRERIRRLESGEAPPPREPDPPGDVVGAVDPAALAGIQEILSAPASGLPASEVFEKLAILRIDVALKRTHAGNDVVHHYTASGVWACVNCRE